MEQVLISIGISMKNFFISLFPKIIFQNELVSNILTILSYKFEEYENKINKTVNTDI